MVEDVAALVSGAFYQGLFSSVRLQITQNVLTMYFLGFLRHHLVYHQTQMDNYCQHNLQGQFLTMKNKSPMKILNRRGPKDSCGAPNKISSCDLNFCSLLSIR